MEVAGDLQHHLRLACPDLADELGVDEYVDVVLRARAVLLLGDQPVPFAHRPRDGGGKQRREGGGRGRSRDGCRRMLDLIPWAIEMHVAALVDPLLPAFVDLMTD